MLYDVQEDPQASIRKRTRRLLLENLWRLVLVGGASLLTIPLFRFLSFHLPRRPRQITVARAIPPAGFILAEDFILFAAGGGTPEPWALSRICTHLGCRLMYRQNLDMLVCPCHQSRFSTRGSRLAGPAKKDLKRFPVQILRGPGGAPGGYVITI